MFPELAAKRLELLKEAVARNLAGAGPDLPRRSGCAVAGEGDDGGGAIAGRYAAGRPRHPESPDDLPAAGSTPRVGEGRR